MKILLSLALAPAIWGTCSTPRCAATIPTTATTASITIPAGSLPTSQSFRLEVLFQNVTWNATIMNEISVGGYGFQPLNSGANLYCNAPDTVFPTIGNSAISTTGAPNSLIARIQRNIATATIICELYDAQTGAQFGTTRSFAITGAATGSTIVGSGISIGGASATGQIGFVRWYNTTVAPGTRPQLGISSAATFLDYEFSPFPGNPNDTNSGGFTPQNLSGISSYINTITFSPSCVLTQQVARLGLPFTIGNPNCQPLDFGTTLTYAWSDAGAGADGIDQSPTFSSTSAAQPTITHLNLFGSLNLQLIVTDGSSNSTTTVIHDGVVPYDSRGIVTESAFLSPAQIEMLGPLNIYDSGAYSFADTRALLELQIQSGNLGVNSGIPGYTSNSPNSFAPFWRTLQSTTCTLTGGSATVTCGAGSNFQSTVCSGTSPVNSWYFVYSGSDGHTHYTSPILASCPSNTTLTLGGVYPNSSLPPLWPNCSTPCTGVQWGYYSQSSGPSANWTFTSAPGNYYDVVMAAETMYWRTGWDTAYALYQTELTYWLEAPFDDYFYNCANSTPRSNGWVTCGTGQQAGRSLSPTGVALAIAGTGAVNNPARTDLLGGFQGLEQFAFNQLNLIPSQSIPVGLADVRDNAYQQAILGECMLIDAANAATCRSQAVGFLSTIWSPFRRTSNFPGGTTIHYWNEYLSQTIGSGSGVWSSIAAIGGAGSVCLTNGSTTVTGTGTSWPTLSNIDQVWFFPASSTVPLAPNGSTLWTDTQTYVISSGSGTSMVLSTPYAGPTQCTGTSGTNAGFEISPSAGVVAWGYQPFMEGLLSQGFSYTGAGLRSLGDSANAAIYQGYAHDAALAVVASIPAGQNGGLLYVMAEAGCYPGLSVQTSPAWQISGCFGGSTPTASQSRTLAQESMRALALDYLQNPTNIVWQAGNLLMAQMWCVSGTCNGVPSDGSYISDYSLPSGTFVIGTPPLGQAQKWAGQNCGFTGACTSWAAITLLQQQGTVTSGIGAGGQITP